MFSVICLHFLPNNLRTAGMAAGAAAGTLIEGASPTTRWLVAQRALIAPLPLRQHLHIVVASESRSSSMGGGARGGGSSSSATTTTCPIVPLSPQGAEEHGTLITVTVYECAGDGSARRAGAGSYVRRAGAGSSRNREDGEPVALETELPVALELGMPVCDEDGVPVAVELGVPVVEDEGVGRARSRRRGSWACTGESRKLARLFSARRQYQQQSTPCPVIVTPYTCAASGTSHFVLLPRLREKSVLIQQPAGRRGAPYCTNA